MMAFFISSCWLFTETTHKNEDSFNDWNQSLLKSIDLQIFEPISSQLVGLNSELAKYCEDELSQTSRVSVDKSLTRMKPLIKSLVLVNGWGLDSILTSIKSEDIREIILQREVTRWVSGTQMKDLVYAAKGFYGLEYYLNNLVESNHCLYSQAIVIQLTSDVENLKTTFTENNLSQDWKTKRSIWFEYFRQNLVATQDMSPTKDNINWLLHWRETWFEGSYSLATYLKVEGLYHEPSIQDKASECTMEVSNHCLKELRDRFVTDVISPLQIKMIIGDNDGD